MWEASVSTSSIVKATFTAAASIVIATSSHFRDAHPDKNMGRTLNTVCINIACPFFHLHQRFLLQVLPSAFFCFQSNFPWFLHRHCKFTCPFSFSVTEKVLEMNFPFCSQKTNRKLNWNRFLATHVRSFVHATTTVEDLAVLVGVWRTYYRLLSWGELLGILNSLWWMHVCLCKGVWPLKCVVMFKL